MPVNLVSAGGGTTTLSPASSASNYTITLPSATTTMVGTDATQTLTNKTINGGALQAATAQTASGTAIDFTGIPSWVKRITVMMAGVTKSAGTSSTIIRLGTSGGFVSSGYLAAGIYTGPSTGSATQTAGFPFGAGYGAGDVLNGNAFITNVTGNTWVWSSTIGQSNNAYVIVSGGYIALSGALTQLRLTNVTGTDTYGGGTINILYE